MRGVVLVPLLLLFPAPALADCQFVDSGAVMRLAASCVTDVSIEIPDGMTLDGDHHTIYAIDAPGRAFTGAVVVARGASASVLNTGISTIRLSPRCGRGRDRLRGIYFEGASGAIRFNTIDNVNRGPSACEEGNAIEIRQPDPGAPPAAVAIERNVIDRYQKTGILLYGQVDAIVRWNDLRRSIAQRRLAANGIQVGPGARATIEFNTVAGNTSGRAEAAGTGLLLVESGAGTLVSSNLIVGDADVGIHVLADHAIVERNELVDSGPDGVYDVGIVNAGAWNVFIDNSIRGYRTPEYGNGPVSDGGSGQQIE